MDQRRSTLKDVAMRSGYALRTVKKVLNNEGTTRDSTKSAVLRAANELHYRPNRLASVLAKSHQIKLAAVYSPACKAYFPEVKHGFERFVEDYRDYGFEVEYVTCPRKGYEAQKPLLNALIDRGDISGIILQPVDIMQLNGSIRALNQSGKPVITFGADAPGSGRLCYIGPNAYKSGKIGAQILANYIGKEGKVCVISETSGHMQTIERNRGFVDMMREAYPKIKSVGMILADDSNSYYEMATTVLADPNLNALFCMDANTFLAGQALRDLGRTDVVLMGFDLSPETASLMRDGYIQVILEQDPETFTYRAAQRMAEYILYGDVPPDVINTDIRLVTSQCL